MNTYEWAQHEIEIACENERKQCQKEPDYQEGNDDYGIMCYQAAGELLKVFEAQGHSGYSAQLVKQIFSRLVDGKPLTPVTDEDDQWTEYRSIDDGIRRYQHKRMSSLFKHVNTDGKASINDIERVRIYDAEINEYYSLRFIDDLVNEIYPITFPYIGQKLVVNVWDISGEYTPYPDIMYVEKIQIDDTHDINIDRYFKRDEDHDWTEIDDHDFYTIKLMIEKKIKRTKGGEQKWLKRILWRSS